MFTKIIEFKHNTSLHNIKEEYVTKNDILKNIKNILSNEYYTVDLSEDKLTIGLDWDIDVDAIEEADLDRPIHASVEIELDSDGKFMINTEAYHKEVGLWEYKTNDVGEIELDIESCADDISDIITEYANDSIILESLKEFLKR